MSRSDPTADTWVACLNGQLIPYRSAAIPVWDLGFTMGVALTERLRTYAGRLPLLDQHLARLLQAASLLGFADLLDPAALTAMVESVVRHNWPGVADGGDLSVGVCVTPGPAGSALPPDGDGGPTILVTALPLDLSDAAAGYRDGIRLVTVGTREVPAVCVPKSIKHRNRLHYYLAEREARAQDPAARAVLLQPNGDLAEGTTASVILVQEGALWMPPATDVQRSIVRSQVVSLATQLKIQVQEQPISVQQLLAADEVLWLSSPVAVMPVTRINGLPIGTGQPGPLFRKLLQLWSRQVGVDLIRQADQAAIPGN